jgi:hypothetical protein
MPEDAMDARLDELDESELAAALVAILDRVHDGERFVVVRNGTTLAILSPPGDRAPAGLPGHELVARIGNLRMPGGGFADEVEEARAGLPAAEEPAWPD